MKHALRRLSQTAHEAAQYLFNSLLRPRRTDICCCGLSKSGTHSLAGIFENYRSDHHPDAQTRLEVAMGYLEGKIDVPYVRKVLRRRDRELWLEMESSALAGTLIEPLVAACPKKKFILTIRDVYSWCDSWIDHNINSPPTVSSRWAAFDEIRLRVREFSPNRYDAPLVEKGFPSLACYFQLWASHNSRILQIVPSQRLLVVKTSEITAKIPVIAHWAGVSAHTLRADKSWLFVSPKKHKLLASLDPSYVRDTAEQFCGTLMHEYFPDVLLGETKITS